MRGSLIGIFAVVLSSGIARHIRQTVGRDGPGSKIDGILLRNRMCSLGQSTVTDSTTVMQA